MRGKVLQNPLVQCQAGGILNGRAGTTSPLSSRKHLERRRGCWRLEFCYFVSGFVLALSFCVPNIFKCHPKRREHPVLIKHHQNALKKYQNTAKTYECQHFRSLRPQVTTGGSTVWFFWRLFRFGAVDFVPASLTCVRGGAQRSRFCWD